MTTLSRISRDELNVYENIDLNDIQALLEIYDKEQLLVRNGSYDGFYQVWILVQEEDGSVVTVGTYHEHSPFRSDYNEIKDTPTRLRKYTTHKFSSRYDASNKIPGYIQPLFKGVELPEEQEETNIKKYRSLDDLHEVYANLDNSKFKAVELYNFYDDELDGHVNYNEEAFKADCVEYLLELGIDLKANKISLDEVIKVNYGTQVVLCNAYADNDREFYGYNYEPTEDHIKVNKVLARALFKLQRKAKGLEEVTASNILELGIKIEVDDFYPVDGNEDLLEYSMVEGVYLYTDICNAEPYEDMVEDTDEEYLDNIKDSLVEHCEDEARTALNLGSDQEIKFKVVNHFKRSDTCNYWDVQTTALVRVL